ncbi:mediator complex subunit [Maudiozyma humilis]|uniref:Mediator of RNA polymerase II transcription subunit 31 n=1 Tax=Maudiozyma humilis TaxID=51915 RepID=A0AAV5RV44_MAUHU|nr:mediator complex subunit [Kazachstania humilis]
MSLDLPTRFEVELEFVQSLANIQYVTYLATQQNNIFRDVRFRNYLKYLEYWSRPPYAQCVVYPNALFVLKLINTFLEQHAVPSHDAPDTLLDNVDELPKFLQLHGPQLMNEMVYRWSGQADPAVQGDAPADAAAAPAANQSSQA